jgi:hypothetical protein
MTRSEIPLLFPPRASPPNYFRPTEIFGGLKSPQLRKGSRTMPTTTATDDRKVIPSVPPLNWRREVPKYRVSRETKPAPKARFRFEPPFSSGSENDVWQYGEKIWPAGSVISSTEWPNPGTMISLNYSAREVMAFFTSRQKSRLPRSPWHDDQVRLDDGMTGVQPNFATITKPRGDDRLSSAHPNAPRPAA